MKNPKLKSALLSSAALIVAAVAFTSNGSIAAEKGTAVNPNSLKTRYPIKHLVVVFNENRSFDHYFGTYPNALNPEGEPIFEPARNTQRDINNLLSNPALLDNNPNANPNVVPSNGQTVTQPSNGVNAANPFRLDRTQADTAGQNHAYTAEQNAYDAGKNDLFPLDVGSGTAGGAGAFGTKGQVMGIFDGNTVTAYWNYAQNFAMSDNAWGDTFGPSTPGLMEMFAGQTNGIVPGVGTSGNELPDGQGGFTLIGDIDPTFDVCSPATSVSSTAKNIGDLLNAADIPWGSFVGGFNLQTINDNGSSGCKGVNSQGQPASANAGRSHVSPVTGRTQNDYVQHHIWFQYFQSTQNKMHLRPTSTKAIGYTVVPGSKTVDPANHAYDLNDFFAAVGSGNFPAVSLIKMEAYQDEHPGNSNSLDAQTGFVNLVNFLQQRPDWDSTAVILAYDDSDGWYDHAFAPVTSPSFSPADALTAPGQCGVPGANEPNGVKGLPVAGRCGPGTRLPFLVISPFARKNYVSHVFITQASIPQFIEDNWLNGERLGGGSFDATTGSIEDMFDFNQKKSTRLILDPTFGTVDTKDKVKN